MRLPCHWAAWVINIYDIVQIELRTTYNTKAYRIPLACEVRYAICLLLGYGVRSSHSDLLYTTYTAWWEVEGSADLDGEFECLDVAALQHHLITMPIKQFTLVTELAYHVCVLEAEVEGQPCPPTGQEWLRALALWLGNGAREPFHSQIWRKEEQTTPPVPH